MFWLRLHQPMQMDGSVRVWLTAGMKFLDFSVDGDTWHIEDYPDAVAVVEVEGRLAARMGHLMLHMHDLDLAGTFAQRIVNDPDIDPDLMTGLLHAGIMHFCKCFGSSSSRGQLPPSLFPAGDARDAYRDISALRDHHLVHDENSLSQARVGAVVNAEGAAKNVADVIAFGITARIVSAQLAQNLINLVVIALAYVHEQIDVISARLVEELNAETRESLLARPPITYVPPTAADMI